MDRVVPEGKDFTKLSVGELDTASRALGADVLDVVSSGQDGAPSHPRKWAGFAWIGFLWAKRQDPAAKLSTFEALDIEELMHAIGADEDDLDEEPETPTTPAPA